MATLNLIKRILEIDPHNRLANRRLANLPSDLELAQELYRLERGL